MTNLPSLRQLQYLIALHKHNHFSKAASACHVSQSTLSAAIAQLEELMGCELLERQHKSFLFTQVGERVVADAKDMVQTGIDLLAFTQSRSEPLAGEVILGCIPTVAPFVLSHVTKNVCNACPQLSLKFYEAPTSTLLDKLTEGELDMVLMALPFPCEGFEEVILAEDPFHLVLHRSIMEKYPHQDVRKLPSGSLFLLSNEHCLSGQCKTQCKMPDVQRHNPFHATSLQTLVHMVQSHQGATFLPQMAINSKILQDTELIARRAQPAGAHRKIALLWRKSNKRLDTFNKLAMIMSDVIRGRCRLATPL